MKKLIWDVLTNPDGLSYSSKRVAGWLTLFATIIYAFIGLFSKKDIDTGALTVLAGLTISFFGLTSVDFKSIITNKIATGDTDPTKV